MNFSRALEGMIGGRKFARADWNGAGQWVVMQKGYPDGIPLNRNTAEATEIPEGTVKVFDGYFMLHTAQGHFVPWLPSNGDLLSNLWQWVSDANQCAPHVSAPEPDEHQPSVEVFQPYAAVLGQDYDPSPHCRQV